MKTFRLFCKSDAKSHDAKWKLQFALARAGFLPPADGRVPDLCIAIGGDGTFLRMVRECDFNPTIRYCGVNTGTLGFLQEIRTDEIDHLVAGLKQGKFTEHEIAVLGAQINGEKKIKCFNEIIIRDKDMRIIKLEVRVDGVLTQRFAGDGMLVCTSAGSTGHNMALGGSVVPFILDTMQITPIAPFNSIAYRSLTNPVIVPAAGTIDLVPMNRGGSVNVCADGIVQVVDNFNKIQITLLKERIKYIKMDTHPFWEKLNKKFIG